MMHKKITIILLSLMTMLPLNIIASDDLVNSNSCNDSLADIVKPLMPAVVNIYSAKEQKRSGVIQQGEYNNGREVFPKGSPFEHFNEFFEHFNMPHGFEEHYSDPRSTSLGSGFIIDSSGYIVTNHHVIKGADKINVKLSDDVEFSAKVIGSDKNTDLALLKIESKTSLPFVRFGDSDKARVGDRVITIGNPFGLGGTVTTGIISFKGRDIGNDGLVDNYIQTDAAINRGNSGGPMFDMKGEVIGINSAIYSPSGSNVGIGFAIPSTTAQSIIDQLKSSGKITRGRLDIAIQEMTPEIAESLDIKHDEHGVLVREVYSGGDGDKAGLKPGDIIIEFAGQLTKSLRKLQIAVAETPINKEVKIVVIRSGKKITLNTKIQEEGKYNQSDVTINKSGINFNNLTKELRLKYDISQDIKGIIVVNGSRALLKFNLVNGDVIEAVNQQNIDNIESFNKIYENAKALKKQYILLSVKRQKLSLFISFAVE